MSILKLIGSLLKKLTARNAAEAMGGESATAVIGTIALLTKNPDLPVATQAIIGGIAAVYAGARQLSRKK